MRRSSFYNQSLATTVSRSARTLPYPPDTAGRPSPRAGLRMPFRARCRCRDRPVADRRRIRTLRICTFSWLVVLVEHALRCKIRTPLILADARIGLRRQGAQLLLDALRHLEPLDEIPDVRLADRLVRAGQGLQRLVGIRIVLAAQDRLDAFGHDGPVVLQIGVDLVEVDDQLVEPLEYLLLWEERIVVI